MVFDIGSSCGGVVGQRLRGGELVINKLAAVVEKLGRRGKGSKLPTALVTA
jgi:hypothetical protein